MEMPHPVLTAPIRAPVIHPDAAPARQRLCAAVRYAPLLNSIAGEAR